MVRLENERRHMVQDAVGLLIPFDEVAALVMRPAQRAYSLLRLGQLYHFAAGTGPYDCQFKRPTETSSCVPASMSLIVA